MGRRRADVIKAKSGFGWYVRRHFESFNRAILIFSVIEFNYAAQQAASSRRQRNWTATFTGPQQTGSQDPPGFLRHYQGPFGQSSPTALSTIGGPPTLIYYNEHGAFVRVGSFPPPPMPEQQAQGNQGQSPFYFGSGENNY